ncbi:hypothetical protein ACFQAT_16095 [Undibacterium arcticum]|uniref:hypothetical protein n=1 Tax=Undibacterium arcticum TaxID=1762892 RepID=UPI0036113D59
MRSNAAVSKSFGWRQRRRDNGARAPQPGIDNWLETARHRVGTIAMRWVGAAEHVHPTIRVVKLADLMTGR